MKVFPSKRVAVVPTRTGWPWSEVVPSMPVWRYCRTTLVCRAVGFAGNHLPMPMNNLFVISVIEDIDRDWNTFLHPKERSGNLAVVTESVNSFARSDVKRYGSDMEGEISLWLGSLVLFSCEQIARSQARDD